MSGIINSIGSKSGIIGSEVPRNATRWFASNNGDQTMSHNVSTTVAFANVVIDTASAFASNTFTVPSGQGGIYLVGAGLWSYDAADRIVQQDLMLVSNLDEPSENMLGDFNNRADGGGAYDDVAERIYMNFTLLLNLSAAETLTVQVKVQTGDSNTAMAATGSGNSTRFRNFFWGYKLIT